MGRRNDFAFSRADDAHLCGRRRPFGGVNERDRLFGGESVAEWSAREGVFELLRRTVAGARPDLADPAPLFLTTTLLWTQLHGIASLPLDRPTFPWPPTAALLAQVLGGLRSRTSDGD